MVLHEYQVISDLTYNYHSTHFHLPYTGLFSRLLIFANGRKAPQKNFSRFFFSRIHYGGKSANCDLFQWFLKVVREVAYCGSVPVLCRILPNSRPLLICHLSVSPSFLGSRSSRLLHLPVRMLDYRRRKLVRQRSGRSEQEVLRQYARIDIFEASHVETRRG